MNRKRKNGRLKAGKKIMVLFLAVILMCILVPAGMALEEPEMPVSQEEPATPGSFETSETEESEVVPSQDGAQEGTKEDETQKAAKGEGTPAIILEQNQGEAPAQAAGAENTEPSTQESPFALPPQPEATGPVLFSPVGAPNALAPTVPTTVHKRSFAPSYVAGETQEYHFIMRYEITLGPTWIKYEGTVTPYGLQHKGFDNSGVTYGLYLAPLNQTFETAFSTCVVVNEAYTCVASWQGGTVAGPNLDKVISFSHTVTGLTPGVEYRHDMGFHNTIPEEKNYIQIQFDTTYNAPFYPSATDLYHMNVEKNSADLYGLYSMNAVDTVDQVYFNYGTTALAAGNVVESELVYPSYKSITGLTPNTKYYYKMTFDHSSGAAQDPAPKIESFVTKPDGVINTASANGATNKAMVEGSFIGGPETITAVKLTVSKNSDFGEASVYTAQRVSNTTLSGVSGTHQFNKTNFRFNLQGLTHKTTYYVRAEITNATGSTFTEYKTFKTEAEFYDVKLVFQNEAGAELSPAVTKQVTPGSSFAIENRPDVPAIEGYVLKFYKGPGDTTPRPVVGAPSIAINDDITVTYIYRKTVKISIYHVDKNGVKIPASPDVTERLLEVGAAFTPPAEAYDGYIPTHWRLNNDTAKRPLSENLNITEALGESIKVYVVHASSQLNVTVPVKIEFYSTPEMRGDVESASYEIVNTSEAPVLVSFKELQVDSAQTQGITFVANASNNKEIHLDIMAGSNSQNGFGAIASIENIAPNTAINTPVASLNGEEGTLTERSYDFSIGGQYVGPYEREEKKPEVKFVFHCELNP